MEYEVVAATRSHSCAVKQQKDGFGAEKRRTRCL
jgi:hypothetical protein